MNQLTIFIPGIMGSSLHQRYPHGNVALWSEDARASLGQLIGKPSSLQYQPLNTVIAHNVLEEVYVGAWRVILCKLLRDEMRKFVEAKAFDYDEFPYDWRQDIFDAARQLGSWLSSKHGFVNDEHNKQQLRTDTQINIITHSMGSLVAALSLMEGYVEPKNVRRLISVGAPFLGAPASFQAAFTTGYLPFMTWVEKWMNKGKNKRARRDAILEALQSFPSTFQLMPHQSHPLVKIRGAGWVHPLSGNILSTATKSSVLQTHASLQNYEAFLKTNNIKYHFIYGTSPQRYLGSFFSSDNTPNQFKASYGSARSGFSSTYTKVKTVSSTVGDGTVPVDSAAIHNTSDSATRTGIPGVKHAYMCNNAIIVDRIKQLLV